MSRDKEQFLNLILENRKIIYKICHAYCRDPEDKKDLEQEIILQLWHSADKYNEQYKLSTWIYRIALNVAISFCAAKAAAKKESHRSTRRLSNASPTNANRRVSKTISSDCTTLPARRAKSRTDAPVSRCPPYKEVGEILGISESNVATKISRIKQQIKQAFKAEPDQ